MIPSVESILTASAAFRELLDAEIARSDRSEDAAFVAVTTVVDDAVLSLIGRVAGDIERVEGELVSRAQVLIDRFDAEVFRPVRLGQHVARNGVVQQTGGDIDRLCAERGLLVEHLKMLVYAWSRSAAAPTPQEKGREGLDEVTVGS